MPRDFVAEAYAALLADPTDETHRAWLQARRRACVADYRPPAASRAAVRTYHRPGSLRRWMAPATEDPDARTLAQAH